MLVVFPAPNHMVVFGASVSPNPMVLLVLQSSRLSCLRILLVCTSHLEMYEAEAVSPIDWLQAMIETRTCCKQTLASTGL